MAPALSKPSLLTIVCIAFSFPVTTLCHPHAGKIPILHRDISPSPTATSYMTATISPCPISGCDTAATDPFESVCSTVQANLSTSDTAKYAIICEVDFPGQDIYPFIHASSFDDCKSHCEDYNQLKTGLSCAGFVYAPDRADGADDCYLKSSLDFPKAATIHLVGATIKTTTPTAVPSATSTKPAVLLIASSGTQAHDEGSTAPSASSMKAVKPAAQTIKMLGSSVNKPTNKYVSHIPAPAMKLATTLLKPGINIDLINKYPLASDSGVHNGKSTFPPKIATMKTTPVIARDGGKGGMINGTHVVIFCDTVVTSDDELVSLVSSSVTTDTSMKALYGNPLELVDNLGEWQDDVGRMRGFAQMTEGEEAFNIVMSGQGYRYAIWPESSPIPLNSTHALIYASIVYDQVDMSTQLYGLSPLGNTLLTIALDPVYGPYASRVVSQLFKQGEITYGSLGGFRAWGPSGPGNQDGDVYLFGQVASGVFVAKSNPLAYTLRDSYSYWDGSSWSTTIPDGNDANALILNEPVKDFDLFYAPMYKTFIMVYMTTMADNTFYYRYCAELNFLPAYVAGGQKDWGEAIHSCTWTQRGVIFVTPKPIREFVYAGGVHAGYYGTADITNGGSKMLVSWTEKSGLNASSPDAGYLHKTAFVDWSTDTTTECPTGANGC